MALKDKRIGVLTGDLRINVFFSSVDSTNVEDWTDSRVFIQLQ